MTTRVAGIYEIVHITTGRRYIGQSQDIRKRWSQHQALLTDRKHTNGRLQGAWTKYGAEAFAFRILEVVTDLDDLTPREQHHLDARFAAMGSHEFNISPSAQSTRGMKTAPEVLAKLSAIRKGRPRTERDLAYYERLRGRKLDPAVVAKLKGRPGRKLRDDERAALAAALHARKGQPITERQRAGYERRKASGPSERVLAAQAARKGRPLTPAQMAGYERRRGRPPTERQLAAIEARKARGLTERQWANYARRRGQKASVETRAKMSESGRRHHAQMSPEARAERAAKIALNNTGKSHGRPGVPLSDEHKRKLSVARRHTIALRQSTQPSPW